MSLTAIQRRALGDLSTIGMCWPLSGRAPRERGQYQGRVLRALVDSGHAVWAECRDGVLPHILPAWHPCRVSELGVGEVGRVFAHRSPVLNGGRFWEGKVLSVKCAPSEFWIAIWTIWIRSTNGTERRIYAVNHAACYTRKG